MAGVSIDDVSVGQALPELTIPVDRAALVRYAAASGDLNPIHYDEVAAREAGLPDVIAHGMFTMGLVAEAVSGWAGPGSRVILYQTKFTSPVVVPRDGGAVIEVKGTVAKVDASNAQITVDLTVTSGGTKVLGRPLVIVRLA